MGNSTEKIGVKASDMLHCDGRLTQSGEEPEGCARTPQAGATQPMTVTQISNIAWPWRAAHGCPLNTSNINRSSVMVIPLPLACVR